MTTKQIIKYLSEYDGEPVKIMEVCGSHTQAISKNGIPSMLSPKISLISGPGCPVCVTPTAYIDRLIDLSKDKNNCIVTFGDLLRVPGSERSLRECTDARVVMVYSPLDTIELAKKEPNTNFIFAAIGFETTTPVYALLIDTIMEENIKNIKLLTAIKTMPEVIDTVCKSGSQIGGFIAPGHVAVVSGSNVYAELAKRHSIPFAVSGFDGESLIKAIYLIVKNRGKGDTFNIYRSVVAPEGNKTAISLTDKYFEKGGAVWRGLGFIEKSGKYIRNKYANLDAGSRGLDDDRKNSGCCCDKVVTGKMKPYECKLFGKLCTPDSPIGACMVSEEGSCFSYFANGRKD